MKRTYIIPHTDTFHIRLTTPLALSPGVGINNNNSVNADEVAVKGAGKSYNVWDEDWSD